MLKNNLQTRSRLLGSFFLLAVVACGKPPEERVVTMDGSSTVYPISKAIAASFEKREPVKVDVKVAMKVALGISGTGGGFRRFCDGQVDIANASRPITEDEEKLCARNAIEFIELPIAYDGLAVVVNPANTWAADITIEELGRLWDPAAEAKITRWSQVRPSWPDEPLHLFGAGTDSGTYDYFSEAVGHKGGLRKDFTASENDDVLVNGVAADRLALGFFGLAYLRNSKERLKVLPVDDGKAENGNGPITPSEESVYAGTYQPLSRPLFIYVSKRALARREVELLTTYYVVNGAKFTRRVGYVPLPENAYILAQKRLNAKRTGSMYAKGDVRIGVSIEQFLAKEQASAR
jgi:phosphate transport system substrate-binding protein